MGITEMKTQRRKCLEWEIKKRIDDNYDLITVVYMG